jgi:hypothetical protein
MHGAFQQLLVAGSSTGVSMRKVRPLATFVVAIVAAAAVTVPGSAYADAGVTGEVTAALDTIDARNDSLVVEAAASTVDADSAAQTATVDIPADPTKGVKLKGKGGKTLTIRMPGARKGDHGKKARNGAVVYGTKGDSVNVAIPGADGTAQMWSHIRNKKAPETYRYCVDGVASFKVAPDGGALGVDSANQPVTLVPSPKAIEKKTGKSVATSYRADGNCLV